LGASFNAGSFSRAMAKFQLPSCKAARRDMSHTAATARPSTVLSPGAVSLALVPTAIAARFAMAT
jgi:hypothetical protein